VVLLNLVGPVQPLPLPLVPLSALVLVLVLLEEDLPVAFE
jgi:hypothetical protein